MRAVDAGHTRYVQGLPRFAPLDWDRERALAERWRTSGDRAAARELVEAHLRFVVKLAHSFAGYGIPVEELIAEGNVGLLEAVERFDPAQGVRFISYAAYWIRALILAHVMRHWSLVRMSNAARRSRLFFRLTRARAQLVSALGHTLSADEIDDILARRLDAPRALVREMTANLEQRDVSLDAPLPDGTTTRMQLLPSGAGDQEMRVVDDQRDQIVRERLRALTPALSPREQYIVQQRLSSDEPETLHDIARRFGISRERVRQIEEGVKNKLRRALAELDPERQAA
jgi:RNA polymerase sigma-32 factor